MEWIALALVSWGFLLLVGASLCRVASLRDPLVWDDRLRRTALAARRAAEDLNSVVGPQGQPFFPSARARAQLTAQLTDLGVTPPA